MSAMDIDAVGEYNPFEELQPQFEALHKLYIDLLVWKDDIRIKGPALLRKVFDNDNRILSFYWNADAMKNMLAAAEKRVKADMRPIQEKMKLDRNVDDKNFAAMVPNWPWPYIARLKPWDFEEPPR